MLPKPKPKKELVTSFGLTGNENSPMTCIYVQALDEAAMEWVTASCRMFVYRDIIWSNQNQVCLHVSKCFDIDEVRAYIDSYNDRCKGFSFVPRAYVDSYNDRFERVTFSSWVRNTDFNLDFLRGT